jgi:hypothetical protein
MNNDAGQQTDSRTLYANDSHNNAMETPMASFVLTFLPVVLTFGYATIQAKLASHPTSPSHDVASSLCDC